MTSIVYNQDCLEAMRQMPDNAFDLAVVDFVGCEIDKEYFDKAEERFQKHTAQMGLWDFGM